MKKPLFILAPLLMTLTLAAPAAQAAGNDPVLIGHYEGWSAYHFLDRGKKVCFISAAPEKQEGNFKKRGPVRLFVTHWAKDKDADVVSFAAGYAFKDGSPATVEIKGRTFDLFTKDEMAWTKDQETDSAITKEMRGGATMAVKSTSRRGTSVTDTYSLKGVTGAYDAMTQECNGDDAPAKKAGGKS